MTGPRLRPGSAAWLLRHELRLAWRGIGGQGSRPWVLAIGGGLLWAALHAAAWAMLRGRASVPEAAAVAGIALWLVITLMVSQAMAQSVRVLFERGDLDLLLASPLPARQVFLVRGLGLALSAGLLYALLLTPLAHVGPFLGRPGLLAIYPGLAGLALGAAAIGLAATLALARAFGARRARTAAQLLGALVGAGLFLGSQAQNLLGDARRAQFTAWLGRQAADGGLLASASPLWWPARALSGDGWPLLGVVIAGAGAFALVIHGAQQRFRAGNMEAMTAAARPPIAVGAAAFRFRGGLLGTVLRKEWRVLWRDPNLIAQTLLQVLYLLPMVFLVGRNRDAAAVAVPGVVFAGGALAGSLAWLTVSAEEAPELLGIAPVPIDRLRWMKVAAALLPVWALCLPLLAFLLPQQPLRAAVFVATLAGATLAAGVAQVWYPRRTDRRDLRHRGKRHPWLGGLEMLGLSGWAMAAWGGVTASAPLALAGGGVGAAVPAAIWWLGRARRAGSALPDIGG